MTSSPARHLKFLFPPIGQLTPWGSTLFACFCLGAALLALFLGGVCVGALSLRRSVSVAFVPRSALMTAPGSAFAACCRLGLSLLRPFAAAIFAAVWPPGRRRLHRYSIGALPPRRAPQSARMTPLGKHNAVICLSAATGEPAVASCLSAAASPSSEKLVGQYCAAPSAFFCRLLPLLTGALDWRSWLALAPGWPP